MLLQNWQIEFIDNLFSLSPTRALEPIAHMAIYRNNYFTNLTEALKTTYPLITKLLGDDFFVLTAKEYIADYPSCHSDLNSYGEYFGNFLTAYAPLQRFPYLPEVAEFEWLCHQILSAEEPDIFDVKILEHYHVEQFAELHFLLHPAHRLLACRYPLLQIIELCEGQLENLEMTPHDFHLQMIRHESRVKLITLSPAEFIFLHNLSQNQTISVALQAALSHEPHFQLEEKLPEWIKNKTIIACY